MIGQLAAVLSSDWCREQEDLLVSNLTLYRAGPGDMGNYTCRLGGGGAEAGLGIELSTNPCEVSKCLEKASTRAFSILKLQESIKTLSKTGVLL